MVGRDGAPILTVGTGRPQSRLNYLEHEIRNRFFHSASNIKFEPGVARIAYGELNMHEGKNSDKIEELNYIVNRISDCHLMDYDSDLNGCTFKMLDSLFGRDYQEHVKELQQTLTDNVYDTSEYIIKEINDFEMAKPYLKYTAHSAKERWCITESEHFWNMYTNGGMNKVYFCYVPGFESVPRRKTEGCPLDDYGLSLIAVIVTPFGTLRSVSCRWNHANGGTDMVMDATQLSKLLGGNVFELCSPPSMPEQHINTVDDDSIRIGGQIWMRSNLCAAHDPQHGILVQDEHTYFTFDAARMEAKKYAADGWRLPTRNDYEKLAEFCGGKHLAGATLKSRDGWYKGGNGGDTVGFCAKPNGFYKADNDKIWLDEACALWWFDQPNTNRGEMKCIQLSWNSGDLDTRWVNVYDGLGVRLIKDS